MPRFGKSGVAELFDKSSIGDFRNLPIMRYGIFLITYNIDDKNKTNKLKFGKIINCLNWTRFH